MDFLNKSIAQLSDLFRSMTPGARITAGLLLAVVVVSMGYLFQHGASGPDAYLFGGEPLPDGELTRVEAAIAKAGLSDYEREGNRIRVPSGQQAKYLAAVADADALPPNFNTIQEIALNKTNPWESGETARQRAKIAQQQTLSQIVRQMYWVENAVVLYDEHETRGLRNLGTVKQATASVSVKPRLGETLTPQRAKNIQKLVAYSVNMNAKDVAITNLGDGGPAGQEGEMTYDSFDDELMKLKIAFEMQKRESILGALRDIPGVSVQVNADFNDTVEEITRSVAPDPKTATQSETTHDESATQTVADNGGRPGVTANGPLANRTADQAQRQNTNETKSNTTETRNMVGATEKTTSKRNLTPREVWATVTIPSAYIKSLWSARNPTVTTPPKPEDMTSVQTDVVQKVENIVDTLLYIQAIKAGDTYKHVRVVVLDSLPAPTIEPPSMASKAVAWTGQYWSTVAMLGVAMFSLMVLRSVVNGKPGDPASAASASSLTLQSDESTKTAESAGSDESDRPRLRLKKGNSLKDDLVEIVREDPDAAADILRSWIAKAS